MAANLGRMISDYRGLIETCRQRADELGISRLEIDRIGGLPSGYAGKLLGRDGGGPRQKRMWPVALESMLGVLGLQILLIEDSAAAARTLALHVKFRNGDLEIATTLGPCICHPRIRDIARHLCLCRLL
jgi:hypothetical protein